MHMHNTVCNVSALVLTLKSTLNAAVRLYSCPTCSDRTVGKEKIQCDAECKAWLHKSLVKIDRSKKFWMCPGCYYSHL